jgi:hypothetical protein
LGNPPPNGIKFFAIVDILELTKDRSWLVKITSAIHQHWHKQNAAKRICPQTARSTVILRCSICLWLPPPANSLKQSPLSPAWLHERSRQDYKFAIATVVRPATLVRKQI